MKIAIITCFVGFIFAMSQSTVAEEIAEKLELADGTMLFMHADGTGRMVDQHGKSMAMADGVEMALKDGRTILMMNKKTWVRWGPPGKGGQYLKTE